MSSLEVKSFDKPDQEFKQFANAIMGHVNVGGQRVIQIKLQPGWKWSKDVKPKIDSKADSCQATHLGIIVKGTVCAKHDDGSEITYSAGSAYSVKPGHDAWVVGDEPVIAYEFGGMWGE